MLTLVKSFVIRLSHFVLGPGGYTRIKYGLELNRRSTLIWLRAVFGIYNKNVTGSPAFEAELRVLEAGAVRFFDKENFHRDLRRDIHRLEKGITAKSRREIFGLEPCTACIQALEKQPCEDSNTDSWAHSVLERYFSELPPGLNGRLDELRNRYKSITLSDGFISRELTQYYLYPHNNSAVGSLEMLISSRRSVRRFERRVVDRKVIADAVLLAVNAPSACNRLPYRFIALDERELIDSVGALAAGTTGWLSNIPNLLVVVGDWSNFSDVVDRHTPYIDASFAVIQLLLKLKKDRLASCVINWKNTKEKDQKVRDLLILHDWEQVITLVAIGYPESGVVPLSIKKDKNSILSWNR